MGQNRILDIDACHIAGTMRSHQQHINAAGPAADIKNALALEIHALEQAPHFRRPARREPAVAPHALQHADHLVVIEFRGL